MTETSLTRLKKLRGSIKRQLTAFHNVLNSITEDTDLEILDLQGRLDKHLTFWNEFSEIQDKIDDTAKTEEEARENESERSSFESRFYSISGLAKKHINKLSVSLASTTSISQPVAFRPTSRFELPKIQAPTFYGTYDTWLTFHDSFKSMCHDNDEIPNIQKFYYLRSCLKDEAAEVIASLETTNDNYLVAWELLKNRYDNRRFIIESHIRSLVEIPQVSKEFSTRSLLDNVQKHVRALKALSQPVDHWDSFLIFTVKEKLSNHVREKWEESQPGTGVPLFKNMISFLEQRALIDGTNKSVQKHNFAQRQTQNSKGSSFRTHSNNKQFQSCNKTTVASDSKTSQVSCPSCSEKHPLLSCPLFKGMSPKERYAEVKKTSLCHNCVKGFHRTIDCRAKTCEKCHKRHHVLLHFEKDLSEDFTASSSNSATTLVSFQTQTNSQVVLGTAIVDILNSKGEYQSCRALLDSCSQCNSITENLAESLGLIKKRVDIKLKGVQNLHSNVKHITSAKIKSRYTNVEVDLSCLIFKEISEPMPSFNINQKSFRIPYGVELADPEYGKPAGIDLLIGAEYFYSLLRSRQIRIKGQSAVFQETALGWIFAGRLSDSQLPKPSFQATCNLINFQNLPILWELDSESTSKVRSKEEIACEEHYKANVEREKSGRYIVKLPFNEKKENLGNSKNSAFQRFHALERKFVQDPEFREHYTECMQSYFRESHATLIPSNESLDQGFYLPHHAVVKKSSLTTKTRIVFDGSAKTSTGISLNDSLRVGPTIQEDLFSIVTRFRSFRYALTADIEQMYRQIRVSHDDSHFQKILWRSSPDEPIQIYALNTVTFGTSCAPFLAIRTLHQLAEDEYEQFPTASTILKRDFYVDDLLTGASTFQEAVTIRNDLIALLEKGGFNIRKWASNDPKLISNFSEKSNQTFMSLDPSEAIKALGLHWDAAADTILYTVHLPKSNEPITKRLMLAQISRLFDPLGLLGPVVVLAKIMIQQLWKRELSWDTIVPQEIQSHWINYKNQLQLLNNIKFDRCVLIQNAIQIQFHGFCDASERAYGACLYVRSTNPQGKHQTSLICSKSRVAPLKVTTIPRLELCAANLLVKLYRVTSNAFPFPIDQTYFWSDSTIVLNWLNTPPCTLKTFVANRVAEIQAATKSQDWFHVPTQDNPADLISRGQNPQDFINNKLWVHGPQWLNNDSATWPQLSFQSKEIPEKRADNFILSCKLIQEKIRPENDILNRFNDFKRLKSVVAHCRRFINNVRIKEPSARQTGRITENELNEAFHLIIKLTQLETFPKELKSLAKNNKVDLKSSLLKLNPFLDQGIIKVGGRLNNANLPVSQKHPIILPKNHFISKIIIRDEHIARMHAGVNATLYGVRETFWPIDGRNTTRHVLRRCVRCCKTNPGEINYIMGNLPKNRVSFSRAFLNVGVDYCGPFFIKERRHRNRAKIKTYVCLFVCLATKAIHLELASDLSTEAFLACLKRFFSRRGKSNTVSSDNATNFVGASKELRQLYNEINALENHENTQAFLVKEGISWHFIPPRAPHFGGLWEAAIKSFKRHFTRVAGNALLTYEQLHTYVVEIEAILNSRPLTPLSSDPNDLLPLTPGHFLIGTSLTSFPQKDLRNVPANRLNCWELAQQMRQHFWNRWHREYLNEQISRSKWKVATNQEEIKVGTLVVIKEDNLPPMKWQLGRITAVHPGQDGVIRAVSVKTQSGNYKRALKLLYPLPIN